MTILIRDAAYVVRSAERIERDCDVLVEGTRIAGTGHYAPQAGWDVIDATNCEAVEACFDIQAVMAARYLAEEHRRCGSWESAVRSYGSGTCDETPGSEKYLSRYLRAKRAVRKAVKEAKQ